MSKQPYQKPYVDEEGKEVKPVNDKKKLTVMGIIIGIILVLILVVIWIMNMSKNNKCYRIEDMFSQAALSYLKENEKLPTALEESIVIKASELIENKYLDTKKFSMSDNNCNGEVKVTKVNNDYIVTPNVTDCGYCSTSTKHGDSWSNPSDKKPNKRIVDVIVTYNYVEKTTNFTSWTNYYTPEALEKDPFEEVTDKRFVKISEDAKNVEIVAEDKTYYRYRDTKWKFYRVNNNSYSDFSSTQPEGYGQKDTNTTRQTEWTEWSVSAPDEQSYRSIEKRTGYRWYYKDGKNKVYYKSGAYTPDQPDSVYTEKEKKDTASVYRYRDTQWRWYNGAKRMYSSFMTKPTNTYIYKDEELKSIGNFTPWSDTSNLNDSNKNHREEITQTRTRYRLKFDMYSFHKLPDFVSKKEFEEKAGISLEEVFNNNGLELITKYQYIYKK